MDMNELIQKMLEYRERNGHLPPELTGRGEKRTKQEENEDFLSMSVEQKAAYINEFKKERYKRRWVPNKIKPEIDMSDENEVRMWRAINFKQRFPYLSKPPEQKDYLIASTILFTYRVGHGIQVLNVDGSEDPVIGQVLDLERPRVVWVELIDVVDRVWKEIET